MRNNSHFTLIMAGIAFLIFTLQATAEPVPKWELDNLWQEGVSYCLYLEDEPKWTREECVGFWDCYIVNLESLFENDYEGFRQLHYRMQIDTLTEEDKTHLLMIEFWCMFP
jgi:hypothetical protein